MPKNRDIPKRAADRRPSLGGPNLVWSLIAAGVAGLFAMTGSPVVMAAPKRVCKFRKIMPVALLSS
jgi:hypothetical protein